MKLYPYQNRAVNYLRKNRFAGAALFMSMRLGKTICVIEALKNIPSKNILVVCPKSVIPSWKEELENAGKEGWGITNYEQLKKWDSPIDTLVVDESVRLKNPKAQITKIIFNFQSCLRKILLSGNPAPNSEFDYFTQMQFISPNGEWMGCNNFWQWRKRYFTSDYRGFNWWPKPGTKELIRKELAKKTFQLTRKQAGLKSQKIYEKRIIEMPYALRRIYKKMEKEFVATLPSGKELEVNNTLVQLNYLQQLAGGFISNESFSEFKVKEVLELLEGELNGESVIIWTQFRWEQEMLIRKMPNALRINGETSLEIRDASCQMFNKQGGIMVISQQCGKYGLNLSRASTAIYFSNSYNFDDRTQSEERIVHLSKNEPLLYIDLVTKDTIQEDILKVLRKKQKNSRYFMGEILGETKKRCLASS